MTGSLRAGVAKSDITVDPSITPVHDPLFAKALVLDDGNTRLAIIAMDTVGIGGEFDIPEDFLPKLRSRIEVELGIPGANVLVNASHTHTPGRMLCDDAEQVERTFDAVKRAFESTEPVTVGAGVGHEDRFTINRTLNLKSGKSWTIRHANPCPPDDEVEGLRPIDPEIGIIRIDRADGSPLAVVFNYACHPLLGVPGCAVTANYPGFASKVIEDSLGGGAMALFLQGAGGDVTEVLYKDVNHPRDAEPVGAMLGMSALEAARKIGATDAALSVASKTVKLPRRTDIPQRIEALIQEQAELLASLRFTSLNFKTFLPLYIKYALDPEHPLDYSYRYLQEEAIGSDALARMDAENKDNIEKYHTNILAMEKLARIQDDIGTLQRHQEINRQSGEDTFTAEVLGIRIGDCVLISCPAEVLVEVGLNVKKASPYKHTFVSAFSNGYCHYGPPATEYDKGGYEVTECLLGAGWQELWEKTAAEVIGRL